MLTAKANSKSTSYVCSFALVYIEKNVKIWYNTLINLKEKMFMLDFAEQKLKTTESVLQKKIGGVDLWGDIELKRDDYDSLIKLIADYVKCQPTRIGFLCERYPVCVTTIAVFLIRYEFNYNFWTLLAERFTVENTPVFESTLGKCILNTFSRFGFDYSEAQGGRKYLDPIIFEAGLPPESNLGDLFYVIKYDTHYAFDPIGVIEDLIESRSYAIRKPMLRFLKRFRDDRAIDFIIETHDAIRCVDYNMSGESKYTKIYEEWKKSEKNKTGVAAHRKQDFQTRPYLMFEDGRRGLCMVLPRTVLAEEWLDEVFWKITSDNGLCIDKQMLVSAAEGRRIINQIIVPVSPAHSYEVQLFAQDGLPLGDYSIIVNGIPAHGALLFNSVGRLINPTFLPSPYCVMVASNDVSTSGENIQQTRQCYPTDADGFMTISVEPIGVNAVFRFENRELRVRPQVELSLEGKTLFNLSTTTGLFTESPILTVSADEGVLLDGLAVRINNDEKRIQLRSFFQDRSATVPLPRSRFQEYGSYSVRLYQDEHFLKQIEFSLVPRIQSKNVPSEVSWIDGLNRSDKRVLRFEKKEGWTLEFDNGFVSSTDREYIVTCPASIGSINGILQNTTSDNGFFCRFTIPIRPIEAEIVTMREETSELATEKTVKLDVCTITDAIQSYWLRLHAYGTYEKKQYSLSLRSQNGIEQTEVLPNLRGGYINFDLSIFADTLRNCPLPALIELNCLGEARGLPLLALRKTARFSERLVYKHKPGQTAFLVTAAADGKRDLILKRFGTNNAFRFYATDARLGNNGRKIGYPCSKPLPDGLYTVDIDTEEDWFFDDADAVFSLSKDTPVVLVNNKTGGNDSKSTIGGFLEKAFKIIYQSNITDEQREDLFATIFQENSFLPLSVQEAEGLILLVAVLLNEKTLKKKVQLSSCLKCVSQKILSEKDRTLLIRTLLQTNCSDEIICSCVELYHLYLFSLPKDAEALAEQLSGKSEKMALLMRLRDNESFQKTIRKRKNIDLIGRDALLRMLSVPENLGADEIAVEQKKFLLADPTSRVKVQMDSDITGEMKPIQEMIVINTKNPRLDMSKKPDTGLYFWQIRYVDQYLNWFKKNYDQTTTPLEKTRKAMVAAQQKYFPDIVSCLNGIKRKKRAVSDYEKVLKKRYDESPLVNLTSPIPARFFYVLGVATLLWELQDEDDTLRQTRPKLKSFLCEAFEIAPLMTERDLMLAAVYTYLIRKEESLCQ